METKTKPPSRYYTHQPKWFKKSISLITDANNPTQDFSNNYRNPETQVNHYYSTLTSRLLNDFYPKFCPKCGIKCSKTVSTRPDLIRCHKCHYLTSRLSGTPLQNSKLPLWMFGKIWEESIVQHPKVITGTEISKRLGVSGKSAHYLKKRLQLFCSDQLSNMKKLTYQDIELKVGNFKLPSASKNEDVTPYLKDKPLVSADTVVLYSASQRANKGRKRHKNTGQTASIYLSKNLGGKQIGTLAHTIAVKNGVVFYHSIPDLTKNTTVPILRETVPTNAPLFTDEGYKYLWGYYPNHRQINHSKKSPDKRYKWSKNRFCENGIHNQVAEGNQAVLKSAFRAYSYIHPKYSQLYLNEFSFFKNLKVIGYDRLVEFKESLVSSGQQSMATNLEASSKPRNLYTMQINSFVRKGKKKYAQVSSDLINKANKKLEMLIQDYIYMQKGHILQDRNPNYSENIFELKENIPEVLKTAISKSEEFWHNKDSPNYKKYRETKYNELARTLWERLIHENGKFDWIELKAIIQENPFLKTKILRIIRMWATLRIVRVRDYTDYNGTYHEINYRVKIYAKTLPNLLYMQTKEEYSSGNTEWRKHFIRIKPIRNLGRRRKYHG